METIAGRLAQLGLRLPQPVKRQTSYVPIVVVGNLVYITGQVSSDSQGGVRGVVGCDLTLEDGKRAARLSALNLLAHIDTACEGMPARLNRIVRLNCMMQCADEFNEIADVMNIASDLMVEVFGDRGFHTRSSAGALRIPNGFTTEIDAVIEMAP